MGDKAVTCRYNENEMRQFTLGVLNDLQALEQMLQGGLFEEDALRIGAEQEMFLVDSSMHPAGVALEVIKEAGDERLTTEIGKFNLEANLTPVDLTGNCFRAMEGELNEILANV